MLSWAGVPLAQHTPEGRGFFVTDPRDNVTQLLDSAGSVAATYAYDPFGGERPDLVSPAASWESRLRYQ